MSISASGLYLALPAGNTGKIEDKKSFEALLQDFKDKLGSGTSFYDNLDYFNKLLVDSGISLKDAKSILGDQANINNFTRLWLFALLMRTARKHQLSARYSEYLKIVSDLIKNGKVNIDAVVSHDIQDRNQYYNYRTNTLILHFLASSFSEPEQSVKAEGTAIHELYHLFQAFNETKLPRTAVEAQAYLVQGDYSFHTDPNYHDRWFNCGCTDGSRSWEFNPSKLVVARAIEAGGHSEKVNNALDEIRRNYIPREMFTFLSMSPEVTQAQSRFYRTVSESCTNEMIDAEQNEIAERFISTPASKDLVRTSRNGFAPSELTANYLFAVLHGSSANLMSSCDSGDEVSGKAANEYLNYYVDIFSLKVIPYQFNDPIADPITTWEGENGLRSR